MRPRWGLADVGIEGREVAPAFAHRANAARAGHWFCVLPFSAPSKWPLPLLRQQLGEAHDRALSSINEAGRDACASKHLDPDATARRLGHMAPSRFGWAERGASVPPGARTSAPADASPCAPSSMPSARRRGS